jgi:hypothetical protein
MSAEIISSACNFALEFPELRLVDVEGSNRRVSVYVLIANLLAMAQFKVVVNQVDAIDVNNLGIRISPFTLIGQMAIDVFESILHLMLGLIGRYMFSSLAMVAFFKFVLFSILESRLLIYTVRARLLTGANPNEAEEDLSTAVRRYYSKFHIFILSLTMWLLMIPGSFRYILLAMQLYWIPQIVLGAVSGQKPSLNLSYILVMGVTRLYTPIYMFWYSGNFFDGQLYPSIESSAVFCGFLVFLSLTQMVVLILQKTWSPRWFVPLMFLPHVYNYYKPLPDKRTPEDLEQGEAGIHECVICMNEVEKGERPAVTPCSHIFHANCLADWLEVKMECPTCRRPLPPMTY